MKWKLLSTTAVPCTTAVSDGSFFLVQKLAGQAWIITDDTTTVQLRCASNVTGHPDTLLSYRAELVGVLGNIVVLNIVFDAYDINSLMPSTLFCDNEGAVTIINRRIEDPHMRYLGGAIPDRDPLFEVQNEIRKMQCTFIVRWIPSHQEGKIKQTGLSLDAILNCECDLRTKEIALHPILGSTPSILHGEKWGVLWNNKLNSNISRILHELTSRSGAESYITRSFEWNTPHEIPKCV